VGNLRRLSTFFVNKCKKIRIKFGILEKNVYLCTMKREELEKIKQKLLAKRAAEERDREKRWNEMKPFETPDDIPDIPIIKDKDLYERMVVKNLIRCGAIPKDKLEVGATYEGKCRNFKEALWDGTEFFGTRYKFGEWHVDHINHFQDDNGYDLFVPIKKIG
jgi:hypothetical protein